MRISDWSSDVCSSDLIERIPLLSDMPVVGELFKSCSKSGTKTNLMVFIRQTILRSKEDARRLTQQRYGYVRDMQKTRSPDVEPSNDELLRDHSGAVPPVVAVTLAPDSVSAKRTPTRLHSP